LKKTYPDVKGGAPYTHAMSRDQAAIGQL